MPDVTVDEVRAALVPLASLIGKSEKAMQKLAEGTWQRTMLASNLRALHLAQALMSGSGGAEPAEAAAALPTLADMLCRSEKAQAGFAVGTAQHTLQRNRIRALRIAEAFVMEAAEKERQALAPSTD